MLKKIFISAVLLLAVLSFVVSLLKGNNNNEKSVTVPDRVAVINISGTIASGAGSRDNIFSQAEGITSGSIMKQIREAVPWMIFISCTTNTSSNVTEATAFSLPSVIILRILTSVTSMAAPSRKI